MPVELEQIAAELTAKTIEGQNVLQNDLSKTARLVGGLYQAILKEVIEAHRLLPK